MLTPEDLDNIEMRQKLSTMEIKEEMTAAIVESFDKHYEVSHKPLKEKVDTHTRLFWLIQGAWAGIVAWIKFGGKP